MKLLIENPKLSITNLMNVAKKSFKELEENTKISRRTFDLSSFLMSGLGIFYLKAPSLLAFDGFRTDPIEENMKTLFEIDSVPSDTHFRRVVDEIETTSITGLFEKYFNLLDKNNIIDEYTVLGKYVLISIDGTGFFHSNSINCASCLQKKHKNGTMSYEHQALPAVMIHPDKKEVFPIGLEIIEKQDGRAKNDCERNAAKRLLEKLRTTYPEMKMIIVEDSLSSNVPHIKELQRHKMKFILGIKPGDHKKFFEKITVLKLQKPFQSSTTLEEIKNTKITRKLTFRNVIDLSSENEEIYINYIELEETVFHIKSGISKTTNYSWITDIPVDQNNVFKLMKMARSRWKIENETFNTLKNQGYNFGHNFGHGKKNLANNMSVFMFLAFLIDQIQQYSCSIYKTIVEISKGKKYVFERIRGLFSLIIVKSFRDLYEKIVFLSKLNKDKYFIGYVDTS